MLVRFQTNKFSMSLDMKKPKGKEILGYSDDEVGAMLAEGVITTDYDAPAVVRPKGPAQADTGKGKVG